MGGPGMAELEYCRSVLLRAVKDLRTEQLDFLVFPDSKSIGETLLHIGGFEFLMISVSAFKNGRDPDDDLWRILQPGFSREAGFAAPRDYPLKHYLDLLSEVRALTIRHLGQDPRRRLTLFVQLTISHSSHKPRAHGSQGWALSPPVLQPKPDVVKQKLMV